MIFSSWLTARDLLFWMAIFRQSGVTVARRGSCFTCQATSYAKCWSARSETQGETELSRHEMLWLFPDLSCRSWWVAKLSSGCRANDGVVVPSRRLLCCSRSWICCMLSCREFEKDFPCWRRRICSTARALLICDNINVSQPWRGGFSDSRRHIHRFINLVSWRIRVVAGPVLLPCHAYVTIQCHVCAVVLNGACEREFQGHTAKKFGKGRRDDRVSVRHGERETRLYPMKKYGRFTLKTSKCRVVSWIVLVSSWSRFDEVCSYVAYWLILFVFMCEAWLGCVYHKTCVIRNSASIHILRGKTSLGLSYMFVSKRQA